MITTLLTVAALAAIASAVYFIWPDRAVRNVIVNARQKKAQRGLDGLSLATLKERALAGNGHAQYRLGWVYANGDGVPVDHSRAFHWFERAADAGIVDAQYCLGLQYEHGRGVTADFARASEYYRSAANAGNADAQCNLGMLFLNGSGVTANTVTAVRWFVLAKAQGHRTASDNLEWVLRNSQPPSAHELPTVQEIEILAERGDTPALLTLGWMYAAGFAKPRDPAAARRQFERAQAKGDLFAHVLLSELDKAGP